MIPTCKDKIFLPFPCESANVVVVLAVLAMLALLGLTIDGVVLCLGVSGTMVEVDDERLKVLAKGPRWVSLSSTSH